MKSKKKIIIASYDPEWVNQFNELSQCFHKHLKNSILAIEHVGSTAVAGLSAKPIIDFDIIVEDQDKKVKTVIDRLAFLGYTHRGDLGIKGREAFKRNSDLTPEDGSNTTWVAHHLYVCRNGCDSLLNHLKLRDYLRAHPKAKAEYSQLKKELAKQHPYNMDAYIEGKSAFIAAILEKQGFTKTQTEIIQQQNKAK